jgi:integrase
MPTDLVARESACRLVGMARTLTHAGRTLTLAQWSQETGIPESTIRSRIDRLGLSPAEALTRTPDARFRPDAGQRRVRVVRPAPAYLCDARGRAYSRWTDAATHARHRRCWGRYGDPAAERDYRRWAAEWLVTGGGDPDQGRVSVARLILRYVDHAEQTYRKHGRATSEVHCVRAALRVVNDLYGDTAAAELLPQRLAAVQRVWADRLSVNTANSYLSRVVRCWSWGVSQGLVPAATADALAHVPGLRPGRTAARVSTPRRPAPDGDLAAALQHLPLEGERREAVVAVLQLLRLTGMRIGEVIEMRAHDIDRSREPWVYVPASGGKMLHKERPRRVYLGPQARAVIAPWLAIRAGGGPVDIGPDSDQQHDSGQQCSGKRRGEVTQPSHGLGLPGLTCISSL